MKELSVKIDHGLLLKILTKIFKELPLEYSKAAEKCLGSFRSTLFRESLISKWISIPVASTIIFKKWQTAHRLTNVSIKTTKNTIAEFQICLNQHGVFGVNISENLEDLIIESIDTSNFLIERIPVSAYLTSFADLEHPDEFEPIDDYLDNKSISEVYTVDYKSYFSIINLSDKNCIVINENNAVFLFNKISGQIKLIAKKPEDFIRSFKNSELKWMTSL